MKVIYAKEHRSSEHVVYYFRLETTEHINKAQIFLIVYII